MYKSHNHEDLVAMRGRDARLDSLLVRHEELETQLHDEMTHPALNWDGVKLIKREKLRVLEDLQHRARELQ